MTAAPGRPGGPPDTYSFVRGATLLAAASLISRLLGGLARIPLTRLLGGEGAGLFQMASVYFGMAITFAVSGLTVATSRVTAEWVARGREREAGRTLGVALLLGLGTGLGFWLALDRGAAYIGTHLAGDERVILGLRAIAPAVLPVSLMGALKGYFQGYQDMVPTSLAQVVEQVVRVGAMIWLVYVFQAEGLERAVGGAAFGNVVGTTAALVVLLYFLAGRRAQAAGEAKARRGRAPLASRSGRGRPAAQPGRALYLPTSRGGIAGRLLGIALPVTVGAAVLPLMDAMQSFIIPGRLQAAGIAPQETAFLYGQLHFMAYPLAGLPAILASALAAALVPAITEALERGQTAQVRNRTAVALRLTVLFSLPAAVGLYILARPINQMLFGIPEAGVPLAYVSSVCLLISLQQATSGILQGLGLANVPAYGMGAGLVANTLATYYLTALPALGINGAALGVVAGFGVAALVNLAVVLARTGGGLDLKGTVLKPGVATTVMALATAVVYGWLEAAGTGNTVATLAAVAAGGVIYSLALLLVGGVRAREIEFIPRVGPGLAALLDRFQRPKA